MKRAIILVGNPTKPGYMKDRRSFWLHDSVEERAEEEIRCFFIEAADFQDKGKDILRATFDNLKQEGYEVAIAHGSEFHSSIQGVNKWKLLTWTAPQEMKKFRALKLAGILSQFCISFEEAFEEAWSLFK